MLVFAFKCPYMPRKKARYNYIKKGAKIDFRAYNILWFNIDILILNTIYCVDIILN